MSPSTPLPGRARVRSVRIVLGSFVLTSLALVGVTAGAGVTPAQALMPAPVCVTALDAPQQVVTGLPTRLRTSCTSVVPRQLLVTAEHGEAAISRSGVIDYTPLDGYTGPDRVTVILPVGGAPSEWRASFDVEVVPNAVAAGDEYWFAAGEPFTVDEEAGLLGNDRVPTAGWMIQRGTTPPAHGALDLDLRTGSFVYTPDADFTGHDSFLYRLTGPDQDAYSNIVTVTLHVG